MSSDPNSGTYLQIPLEVFREMYPLIVDDICAHVEVVNGRMGESVLNLDVLFQVFENNYFNKLMGDMIFMETYIKKEWKIPFPAREMMSGKDPFQFYEIEYIVKESHVRGVKGASSSGIFAGFVLSNSVEYTNNISLGEDLGEVLKIFTPEDTLEGFRLVCDFLGNCGLGRGEDGIENPLRILFRSLMNWECGTMSLLSMLTTCFQEETDSENALWVKMVRRCILEECGKLIRRMDKSLVDSLFSEENDTWFCMEIEYFGLIEDTVQSLKEIPGFFDRYTPKRDPKTRKIVLDYNEKNLPEKIEKFKDSISSNVCDLVNCVGLIPCDWMGHFLFFDEKEWRSSMLFDEYAKNEFENKVVGLNNDVVREIVSYL